MIGLKSQIDTLATCTTSPMSASEQELKEYERYANMSELEQEIEAMDAWESFEREYYIELQSQEDIDYWSSRDWEDVQEMQHKRFQTTIEDFFVVSRTKRKIEQDERKSKRYSKKILEDYIRFREENPIVNEESPIIYEPNGFQTQVYLTQ